MDRNDVFDIWSVNYDEDIRLNNSGYPFEGYYDVIRYIQDNVVIGSNSLKILDMGVGPVCSAVRSIIKGRQSMVWIHHRKCWKLPGKICPMDYFTGGISQMIFLNYLKT